MKPSFEGLDDVPHVPAPVFHVIRNADEKFVSGHNRLRQDIDKVDEKMKLIQKLLDAHEATLSRMDKRTTDVGQLRFTPQMVASIVAVCASIIVGSYASTWGLRDNQATLAARMEVLNVKMDAAKQHEDDALRAQDERAASVQRDMTQLRGQATMIDTKINNLMSARR